MPEEMIKPTGKQLPLVEELIPQRAPMVMIDRVTLQEGSVLESELELRPENMFLREGLFLEEGVLEHIAQTAAALNGFRAWQEGTPVKNGYIGAIKNLEFFDLPALGALLQTRVEERHFVMGASVIYGECREGDRLVASCEMKVFMEE